MKTKHIKNCNNLSLLICIVSFPNINFQIFKACKEGAEVVSKEVTNNVLFNCGSYTEYIYMYILTYFWHSSKTLGGI